MVMWFYAKCKWAFSIFGSWSLGSAGARAAPSCRLKSGAAQATDWSVFMVGITSHDAKTRSMGASLDSTGTFGVDCGRLFFFLRYFCFFTAFWPWWFALAVFSGFALCMWAATEACALMTNKNEATPSNKNFTTCSFKITGSKIIQPDQSASNLRGHNSSATSKPRP